MRPTFPKVVRISDKSVSLDGVEFPHFLHADGPQFEEVSDTIAILHFPVLIERDRTEVQIQDPLF